MEDGRGVRPVPHASSRYAPPSADEEAPLATPSATPSSVSSAGRRDAAADAAAAAATAAGAGDDDEAVAPQAGPLTVWLGLLGRLLLSLSTTLVTALLFVLYPVYCLIPRVVLEGVFRGLFRVGYLIYLTPFGAWLHARGVKPNTPPHSLPAPPAQLSTATVLVVPILDNNYAYLLVDTATRCAAAVDPADPYAVLRAAQAAGVTLTHILTTHHHHDHAGGNVELARMVRAAEGRALVVVGGVRDRVPGCTLALADGATTRVGQTTLRVLETPCHTRGHVLFCVLAGPPGAAGASAAAAARDDAPGCAPGCCGAPAGPLVLPAHASRDRDVEAVFSGDTVFVGGVGAFFHGDATDMERNLSGRMAGLPDTALLFCGHEYTADNMRFAAWLEPDNMEVVSKFLSVSAKRAAGEPTVPSTLGAERRTNPYFRAREPALQAAAGARAAWVARRRARPLLRRAWDAMVAPAGPPPMPPPATPVAVYRTLQELLAFGAWQSFKLNAAAAGAVRRRAAAAQQAQAATARAMAAAQQQQQQMAQDRL